MKKKILLLNQERIDRKLQRMAFQIWENNSQEEEIDFIGIAGTGLVVARQLARRVGEISPLKINVHSLSVNKRAPLDSPLVFGEDMNEKSVLLIDDVANSGRTLLYALRPILDFQPRKILIAVLMDRTHKTFPVSPDIIGHSVSTTLQEHIEVTYSGEWVTGAYLS